MPNNHVYLIDIKICPSTLCDFCPQFCTEVALASRTLLKDLRIRLAQSEEGEDVDFASLR